MSFTDHIIPWKLPRETFMRFAGLTHFVLPILLITSLLMALARGIDRKSLFYRNHVNEEIR